MPSSAINNSTFLNQQRLNLPDLNTSSSEKLQLHPLQSLCDINFQQICVTGHIISLIN